MAKNVGLDLLEQAILYTLSYSAQFQYPLTLEEIQKRLLSRLDEQTVVLSWSPTKTQLQQALIKLKNMHLVGVSSGHFFLLNQSETFLLRRERQLIAEQKWQEVAQLRRIVSYIPWIKAIYITGSLAMDNTQENEDIDFMIITSHRRLWLTRLLVSLFAWLKGKRRSWQGEEQRSWCFNLWLEETELPIFAQSPSVYIAYELIQARLILDKGGVGKRLQAAHQWVRHFLPQATLDNLTQIDGSVGTVGTSAKVVSPATLATIWSSTVMVIGDIANMLAFYFQKKYMKPHRTRELVTENLAFFHPRDTQNWLYSRWLTELKKLV